jgi:hypothetical protein
VVYTDDCLIFAHNDNVIDNLLNMLSDSQQRNPSQWSNLV